MQIAPSKRQVPIRLTDERWRHIVEEHSELSGRMYEVLEAVEDPDEIRAGNFGALLAIREVPKGGNLIVVYKEISSSDGFVITAFFSRRKGWLKRRKKIWPPLD